MSTAQSASDVEDVATGGRQNDKAAPALEKNQVLITLFEKMGVPLINAISAVEMWQKMDSVEEIDAEAESVKYATSLASLLNRTVSLSTALSEKLELEAQADHKHRLDVAAVSTLMIAHQYALTAQVPDEADIPKITDSMQSVLSFADYFSGSPELTDNSPLSSEALLVQCLDAVVPLAHTVERFSFGKQGQALLSDILDELGKRVAELCKALGQDMNVREMSAQKIQIFKSSAQLFTLCYEAEMNSLMQVQAAGDVGAIATPKDRDVDQALERIWKSFDDRVALLRMVLGYVNSFFSGEAAPAAAAVKASSVAKESAGKNADKSKEQKPSKADLADDHAENKGGAGKPEDKPKAPSGFSPIQAVIDRAEGKDVSSSSDENSDDDDGDKKSDDGNPMSFFTGK